ncbi:MAG: nuclear transport factor 2 family protein [Marinilabiliaceae bacterium]
MEHTKSVPRKKEIVDEVDKVLKKLLRSQEQGDVETFANCFLHNKQVVHIGTDTDEYFTSWRDYFHWVENVLMSRKEQEINEKATRINISEDGNTAWFSQLIDTCYETRGETTRIEGFRHTGVLVNTPEGWKIVQSHISAPVDATS